MENVLNIILRKLFRADRDLRLRDTLTRELVFRGVHHWSFCYFVRARARREGHEIGLVTVIRGMQDTAKRDKIEIDVARARGRKKRGTKGKGVGWGRGRASGLGVQLGADVTAIRRYRKPRDRFFFFFWRRSRHAAGNFDESKCMDGVIRTNVITARFASMQRTCASKAESIHCRS